MTRATRRRWASRAVMAAAVLACVATSPPRWHIPGQLPPDAPAATPRGGSTGIVVDIEASELPEIVNCNVDSAGSWLELAPLHLQTTASHAVHAEYLCPPGGTLEHPELSGRGHSAPGCSGPDVPDDAFFRVTRYAAAPVWSSTLHTTFELKPAPDRETGYRGTLVVHGVGQAEVHTDEAGVIPRGHNRFELTEVRDGAKETISIDVIEYGACPTAAPCSAPAGEAPTIEAVP